MVDAPAADVRWPASPGARRSGRHAGVPGPPRLQAADPGPPGPPPAVDNAPVAAALREMSQLLQSQHDNPYRALAYARAADTVAGLGRSVREIHARDGEAGLDALPAIGRSIAASIAELLTTGRWRQLEAARRAADPIALLATVPGVGRALAGQLQQALGVTTLEGLEAAAHDGRLARVPRLGARRAAAIGAALTQMLDRGRALRRGGVPLAAAEPPVAALLEVDRDYRAQARAGKLPTIAPRRFNPEGQAWLPVLHTQRGDWHYTALFSNTARAHALDRVHDWVVIYAEDPQHAERQYTVVTAARGGLAGRRVVRGREAECRALAAPPG